MNLYDFNRHTQESREELVWKRGEFLIARPKEKYYIVLYDMGKFFAEIWYRIDSNSVELVRGFNGLACLKPYLDIIDLTEITGN